MTNGNVKPSRFFSYRTLLGLLAGIMVWLIFALFFDRPSQLTPEISLVFAMLLSGLSQPKHLAGLGALIGIAAGLVLGIEIILQNPGVFTIFTLIGWDIGIGIFIFVLGVYFAFTGFCIGQIVRLYRRGAIF